MVRRWRERERRLQPCGDIYAERQVVLVGERANGAEVRLARYSVEDRLRRGGFAFGAAARRLRALGLEWGLVLNLLPGMLTREATFHQEDRRAARKLAEETWVWAARKGHTLVLAGGRVAQSFGVRYEPLLDAHADVDGTRVQAWVIPHPSGMCRWWNEAENLERFRRWAESIR